MARLRLANMTQHKQGLTIYLLWWRGRSRLSSCLHPSNRNITFDLLIVIRWEPWSNADCLKRLRSSWHCMKGLILCSWGDCIGFCRSVTFTLHLRIRGHLPRFGGLACSSLCAWLPWLCDWLPDLWNKKPVYFQGFSYFSVNHKCPSTFKLLE